MRIISVPKIFNQSNQLHGLTNFTSGWSLWDHQHDIPPPHLLLPLSNSALLSPGRCLLSRPPLSSPPTWTGPGDPPLTTPPTSEGMSATILQLVSSIMLVQVPVPPTQLPPKHFLPRRDGGAPLLHHGVHSGHRERDPPARLWQDKEGQPGGQDVKIHECSRTIRDFIVRYVWRVILRFLQFYRKIWSKY